MTLRDEIAEIIQTIDEPWLAADDIMTAVREALLSDEAVEAMALHLFGTNGMAFISETKRKIVRDNITAALDAVTGEDDER